MKVAVASGKGGTGKTMVTASLAVSWNSQVAAVDLDVEEPNLHFFMQPQIWGSREAFMDVPADAIINKIDLDSNNSREIQLFCRDSGLPLLAELPHDTIFVEALVKGFGHYRIF